MRNVNLSWRIGDSLYIISSDFSIGRVSYVNDSFTDYLPVFRYSFSEDALEEIIRLQSPRGVCCRDGYFYFQGINQLFRYGGVTEVLGDVVGLVYPSEDSFYTSSKVLVNYEWKPLPEWLPRGAVIHTRGRIVLAAFRGVLWRVDSERVWVVTGSPSDEIVLGDQILFGNLIITYNGYVQKSE